MHILWSIVLLLGYPAPNRSVQTKKPQLLDQQPQSPICYCIWKVPDERLFVRKEIRCGDVPDYFACAFLDGVYVIKR